MAFSRQVLLQIFNLKYLQNSKVLLREMLMKVVPCKNFIYSKQNVYYKDPSLTRVKFQGNLFLSWRFLNLICRETFPSTIKMFKANNKKTRAR